MMTEATRCPSCGNVLSADLGGRCPECMLKAGLDASATTGPATVDYPTRPTADNLPRPGTDFGAYHLVRVLGQGGMGTVFEAEDRATGRRLALKVLSHSLDSPSARQRFLSEGRLAASVNHPHSLYVFGTDEIDDAPVISMELVQGGTLQDRVRERGPLPTSEAVDAVLQVIDGLEAAHAAGILHRDVKPSNCFVEADDTVKIGDFGLSISRIGRGATHLTASGVFLGTPAFASPEQLRGDELDLRSDLYAVGVTLFYLLTGRAPFEAEHMVQLVATVLEKSAPDVREIRPEVPRDLALVVQCCLEKDRGRRFRNYGELRAALLPFSSLLPTPATPARRFAAGAINWAALLVVNRLLAAVLLLVGLAATLTPTLGQQALSIFLIAAVWFLYYVLPEGLLGVSLGKGLLRLRVTRRQTMHPPGIGRAAWRAFVYYAIPSLPVWLYTTLGPRVFDEQGRMVDFSDPRFIGFMAAGFASLPLWALLFVTMRRGNGYAAIHDLLSDTHVILKPWAATRPVPQVDTADAAPAADATAVGPYHLLARLDSTDAGEWHLGYDTRLLRKVWLRLVPAGAPVVSAAVRDQTRSGRLRWLTGRREAGQNWDAFEAPTGQPLCNLLAQPHDWDEVRYWLLDLSDELARALADGTLPAELALDRVWITAEGRAKLLDFPAPGTSAASADCKAVTRTKPGEVAIVRDFLQQVVVSGLRGRAVSVDEGRVDSLALPLPLHARPILEHLSRVQRLEVLHADLDRFLSRPTRVTVARRWAVRVACVLVPVVVFALSLGTKFVSQLIALSEQPDLPLLKDALYEHTPPFGFGSPPTAERRVDLETIIAGRFRDRIQDPAFWQKPYVAEKILPSQRRLAEDIVARTPLPSEEQIDAAIQRVDLVSHEILDELKGESASSFAVILIFAGTVLLLGVSLPSIFAALFFGGGLAWRLFGITAVTADGRPASRWRVTLRQLLVWAPLWLLLMVLFIDVDFGEASMLAGLLVAAVLFGLMNVHLPRSYADRLAGTWLVVR